MAQQNINIGSSANKGDGDPIRTAFTKVNANFTELYAQHDGTIAQKTDITGSVFGDDSTLLVDAVSSTIPYAVLSGTPTIPTVISDLTDVNSAGTINGQVLKFDTLNGWLPGDAETITLATLKTEVAASTDFADFKTRIAAL